jgi:hypothetical protein
MTQTSTTTQNDIIRYLFNETSKKENIDIEDSIATCDESLNFFFDCLQISERIKNLTFEPKQSSIDKILMYSKNFEPAI